MTPLIKTLVAAVSTTLLVAGAFAQSTVVNAENEPATVLTVLPPLPGPLAQGVVFIPYRLENLRIVPVGGAAARDISPASRTLAHHARRSPLAVGGLRRKQHGNPRRAAARRAQSADRGSGPRRPSVRRSSGDVLCAKPRSRFIPR